MATWNADIPTAANQISADITDIRENFTELKSVIEAITTGTLGTTEPSAFEVCNFVSNTNGASNISDTAFDISTNLTESTWESFGPTSSGKTNIWTALDSVPSTASWIEVKISIYGAPSPAALSCYIYGRKNGSSASADATTLLAGMATYGNLIGTIEWAKIPINSRSFDLYFTDTNVTASITMTLVGYGIN